MKKYLVIALSVMMMATMSMTVCAATSPDKNNSSNVSSDSTSSKKSSSKKSSSSSAASTASASTSTSASSTKAAKDAEVQKKIQPTQAVVVNGQPVDASVTVESTTEQVNASFGVAAQYYTASPNAVITDTFAVNVAGLEGTAAPVSMVFTLENLPANFVVVVQDAAGNWSCITPDMIVGNSILLTIPAQANIAIVTVPAA